MDTILSANGRERLIFLCWRDSWDETLSLHDIIDIVFKVREWNFARRVVYTSAAPRQHYGSADARKKMFFDSAKATAN